MIRKQKEKTLLQVKNLTISFRNNDGKYNPAVNNIDFDVFYGETVGVIGESGCGKSVTALSLLNLVPYPIGKIERGNIFWKEGKIDILNCQNIEQIRKKEISIIFQDSLSALNPLLTIGTQIYESIDPDNNQSKHIKKEKALQLLEDVGLNEKDDILKLYPHQLSGGMRQRILIACALASQPLLLIADEPTTALDVTIQAQILKLINTIQQNHNMSLIMITHDLGVITQMCDYVYVMYAGRIVEQGYVDTLFKEAQHPYTRGLIRSTIDKNTVTSEKLLTIEGSVPSLKELSQGCPFVDRCKQRKDICSRDYPQVSVADKDKEHYYYCYNPCTL